MILSLTWSRMTGSGAVAGLVVGALTVIAWISLGFLFAMAAIVIVSLATEAKGEFRPLAGG